MSFQNCQSKDRMEKKSMSKNSHTTTHKHDWRLMKKSNISTRFANAPLTRDTIIDIVLDPGDRSETWRCPDCGEERFYYTPGFLQLLATKQEKEKL